MSFRLYAWQRITAMMMVPFIALHVAVIFYATNHALTAADILARTRGSSSWAAFYGAFVVLASIHGAIGVRSVLADWTPFGDKTNDAVMWLFGVVLAVLGMRAVWAVVLPGVTP